MKRTAKLTLLWHEPLRANRHLSGPAPDPTLSLLVEADRQRPGDRAMMTAASALSAALYGKKPVDEPMIKQATGVYRRLWRQLSPVKRGLLALQRLTPRRVYQAVKPLVFKR